MLTRDRLAALTERYELSVAIYGQESNRTTWRMARMNLAIRAIEAQLGAKHAGTFLEDLHPDLRADFILANPPFNVSAWSRRKASNMPLKPSPSRH